MAEINELLDIDPTRVDIIAGPARPAVPSARRFLFFKSNQMEGRTMEKEVVRDLDNVLADLQKATTSEDKEKINSELIGLVKDVQASVADIDDPMKAEVAKAVADKIEAVLKSDDGASAKDELASLITDLNSVIQNLQKNEDEEKEGDDNVEAMLAKSDIPETAREDVVRLVKEEAERVKKAAEIEQEALREQLKKADEERAEQRKRIEKMEHEARKATWIAKAEVDFAPLPAKSDELADLIMKAEDADSENAQKLVDLLKASAEIIKQGNFYSEIGTSEDFETSPLGKVEALAKSYVEQGLADTMIAAKARVWKEHPEYRRELREGE